MTSTTSPPAWITSHIWIASDHAGFDLKQLLLSSLKTQGLQDLGPSDASRVDYPDFADLVASRVSKESGFGILICGSGQGMAIRANRYPGVRAALCWSEESASLSRQHNDANIICLGARLTAPGLALKIVQTFFTTSFEGGRHAARVEKLERIVR